MKRKAQLLEQDQALQEKGEEMHAQLLALQVQAIPAIAKCTVPAKSWSRAVAMLVQARQAAVAATEDRLAAAAEELDVAKQAASAENDRHA